MQKLISKLKSHRVEGITKRWLINIIGVIAVLFIICFVLSSFAIKSYYYASVENIVNSGASQSAVSYFSNNIEQGNSLESCASSYMESYSYKNRTTLWIIDDLGNVVLSSSGFSIKKQNMPDYTDALKAESGTAKFVGKLSNGEKVMAVTRIIKDKSGNQIGAIRAMTDVDQVDDQIGTLILLIAFVFVVIWALLSSLTDFLSAQSLLLLRKSTRRQSLSHKATLMSESKSNITMKSATLQTASILWLQKLPPQIK